MLDIGFRILYCLVRENRSYVNNIVDKYKGRAVIVWVFGFILGRRVIW